jgi:pimeloyl-ACP methyl ester carboxylesterase
MARPFPHVDGVEHRYVEARGLRFHIAEAGSLDADPLLILHGWPQHWYEWRRQIPALAPHYHLIVPDLRGFGWSDAPPTGYEKENMATDVLALLDAMGLERVRLIGHDWGGWIGFIMCVRAPERFSRFLALNIPHLWGKPNAKTLLGIWRFWYQWVMATPGLGPYVVGKRDFAGFLLRRIDPGGIWTDEERAAFTEPLREPDRTRATVQLYRTFIVREFMAVAAGRYKDKRLTVPTRLLFGTQDFAISSAFLADGDTSAFADDFTIELAPDTGHYIAEQRPDLVNERALEFMRDAA